jgi:hypothetical protein
VSTPPQPEPNNPSRIPFEFSEVDSDSSVQGDDQTKRDIHDEPQEAKVEAALLAPRSARSLVQAPDLDTVGQPNTQATSELVSAKENPAPAAETHNTGAIDVVSPGRPQIIAPTPDEIRRVNDTRLSGVAFPESAYLGIGAKFAEFYDLRSEPPKEFFYLEFLTQAGGMLSGSIRADFPYSVQPRLYLLKIGPAGWGRKSFCSEETQKLFERANSIVNPGETLGYDDPHAGDGVRFQKPLHTLSGAGSGEGLVKIFDKYHRVLFHLDELHRLEQKLAIDGSTLLTALIELFGKNHYENLVLRKSINIRNAHLVLSANTTTQNFESMIKGGEMVRSGFFGRFLFAANETEKRITRSEFPETELEALANEFAEILRAAPSLNSTTGLPTEERVIPFGPAAFELWDEFYQNVERTEETERFDTYGQRLMAILAFTSGKSEVDVQVVRAVLDILEYQRALREIYWPSQAESKEALVQEKVLRFLRRKAPLGFTVREIEQNTKLRKKYGAEAIPEALRALGRGWEVLPVPLKPGQKQLRYRAAQEEA